jgi:hypothetical protein
MAGWRPVAGDQAERLERELARELPSGHPLRGHTFKAHARRDDRDDVAYLLNDGRICVVHLTWNVETDPRWPSFEVVKGLADEDLS